MRYIVTAQAFNRESGTPASPAPRDEVIDTDDNSLFESCNTIMDVKQAYERFWNDLNPRSREVVFVQSVRREV
jgi:hypothetical protein